MKNVCLPLSLLYLAVFLTVAIYGQSSLPASAKEFATRLVQAPDQQTRLSLLKEKGDLSNCELTRSLNEESDKLIRQRQNEKGREISLLAKEVAASCPGQREMATAINNIGRAYYQMSEYEQALEYFQQALKMRRELPDQWELAQSLNNVASVYEIKGLYSPALNYYEQSLAIKQPLAQGNKDRKGSLALSYTNVGLCHKYLRNLPLALKYYQAGLQLYEELKDAAGIARLHNHLGITAYEQGQLALAVDELQQSLHHNQNRETPERELQAQILNNLGLVYYADKKYDLALQACRQSLQLREELKNTERIARTQRRLARIYLAQNNFAEALAQAQSSARLSQQHPETFWQALLVEGEVHLALKNQVAAERCFTEAIQTIEAMRTQAPRLPEIQQRFFEDKITPYLAMTDLLLTQGRRHEALAYAERTKARVILDLIQTGQTQIAKEMPALLSAAPLTPTEMAALVPTTDTVLLEFVVANEKVHLFALTKAQAHAALEVQTISLDIKASELTALVQKFRQEVAERKLTFAAPAQALYQRLLQPVAGLLQQRKNVVIVPDGILWELPFQALMPDATWFLWEDHTIFYAPSLTALREINQRHLHRKPANAALTLLALGNPALTSKDPAGLAPEALPHAERQVRQLRQIYGLKASKVLVGGAATEQVFKTEASKYSVLHLATHGIYDDRSPMSSRVLLTPANGEDGQVEAQEILNLKLTNEIIVLSACETGRGRIGPGEGMIGLTWAFLIAGCPTLVASQWEVRDDSTSTLMTGFHRALKTTPQRRADALRQSALALLKSRQYHHPYYWAGFVLIGDGY